MMPAEPCRLGQSIFVARGGGQRPLKLDFTENRILNWSASGSIVTVELDRYYTLPRRRKRYTPAGLQWQHLYDSHRTVSICDDNRSYIPEDDVYVTCPGRIRWMSTRHDGDWVIVDRDDIGPGRNLFRYSTNGSLLWQVDTRTYRADDPFTYVEFKDDKPIAWAMMNGWCASIDKKSGAFLKVCRRMSNRCLVFSGSRLPFDASLEPW